MHVKPALIVIANAWLRQMTQERACTVKKSISKSNEVWTLVEIEKIPVRNGRVEIGFLAEGNAGAFCYVDDISLVKDY